MLLMQGRLFSSDTGRSGWLVPQTPMAARPLAIALACMASDVHTARLCFDIRLNTNVATAFARSMTPDGPGRFDGVTFWSHLIQVIAHGAMASGVSVSATSPRNTFLTARGASVVYFCMRPGGTPALSLEHAFRPVTTATASDATPRSKDGVYSCHVKTGPTVAACSVRPHDACDYCLLQSAA